MHNLTYVYKCLQNIAPDLIKSYFIKSSDVYSIRGNGLDILIPKVRTESANARKEHFIVEPRLSMTCHRVKRKLTL